MIQSYKDLKAYEKSYQMVLEMYREASTFPKEELYGLSSQIKRAAVSIPLNIAEGYGKRRSVNEFKRYLLMAIGSCDEMKVLINLCKDLGFIEVKTHDKCYESYEEIGRMLNGLHAKWEAR